MADGRFLLVDLEGPSDPTLDGLREQSGFWTRLASLELPTVLVARSLRGHPSGLTVRRTLAQALGWARSQSFERCVFVAGDQLFVDPAVVQTGIERWEGLDRSYFSQWEHTRIPVGIGARMATVSALEASGASCPSAAFAELASGSNSAAYDDQHLVGHAVSGLDSRASEGLIEILARRGGAESWDLEGFVELAAQTGSDGLRYQPVGGARWVDERGMPARFGFESLDCAVFPTYVMFDATNLCNARCQHCPQGIPELRRSFQQNPAFLEAHIFEKVIDECASRPIDFVRITADGEPLLHKGLFDLLNYATKMGVGPVGLTTNASLLDESRSQALLQSGIAMVDFSLDAVDAATFEAVRVGLKHGRVMGNILRFLRMRNEQQAAIKVVVSFVEQELNQNEVEEFRRSWTPLVDEVLIREMISNVNLNDVARNDRVGETDRWPCPHYFRRVVINYDGWIKACPIDWKSETRYRSLEETSIYDAWHGDHYWKMRMEHLNGIFSADSACGPCDDWIGTPWTLGYEKMVKRLDIPASAESL